MLHRSKTGLASKRTWESAVVCLCRSCRVLPCRLLLNATQLQPPSREHHLHPATEPTKPPNTSPRNSTRGNPTQPRSAMMRHSARRVREWADGRSTSKRVPMSAEQGMSMEHRAGASSDQIKRTSPGLTRGQVHSDRFTVHRLRGGSLSPPQQEPRSLVRRWAHPPSACGDHRVSLQCCAKPSRCTGSRPGTRDVAKGCITHLLLLLLLRLGRKRDMDASEQGFAEAASGGCVRFFTPLSGNSAVPSYQSDNLISSLRGLKGSPVRQGSGGVIRPFKFSSCYRKLVRDRCRAGARIKKRGGCY